MRAFNLLWYVGLCLLVAPPLTSQKKYNGPRPPKADVPYLAHADNLVETEANEAREEKRKNETIATIPGASSPVRTPLAEPIFLFQSSKLGPEQLELWRLESKGGNRQIGFPDKIKKDSPRPVRMSVSRLEEGLYRLEANENLETGEYSLSPKGTSQVFCFQVY